MSEEEIKINEEAHKHATNQGMMMHVFPEKEASFIKGAMSESAKDYWFKQFKEQPQDSTEGLTMDELLEKHGKKHMLEWDLGRFKITHRRLYATMVNIFNELN